MANEKLRTSAKGLALLEEFEGLRLKAYKDGGGVWTIGWGTTRINGKPVTEGMTCTKEQAREWKLADMARFESDVKNAIKIPLTQNQFDALVVLTYNIGGAGFLKSTLAHHINAGKPIFEDLFTRWNKDNGKVVDGLTRRRKAEYALYITP